VKPSEAGGIAWVFAGDDRDAGLLAGSDLFFGPVGIIGREYIAPAPGAQETSPQKFLYTKCFQQLEAILAPRIPPPFPGVKKEETMDGHPLQGLLSGHRSLLLAGVKGSSAGVLAG
jgi:hypothetical protein